MGGSGDEVICVTVRIPGARNNGVVVVSVAVTPDQTGLMFWFTRSRFFGSYFALIDASRA